jgi:hypothetical protein
MVNYFNLGPETDGRLLFSITLGAEVYYAVKGRKTQVVASRYVEEEYKVGNGGVQHHQQGYQNGTSRY